MSGGVYSISEVSRAVGLSAHTLRYYEAEDLMVFHIERDLTGRRSYQERDITWLRMLIRLRDTAMPIEEIRAYIALIRTGDETAPARLAILRAHRARVAEQIGILGGHLTALDTKINLYDTQESIDGGA